jgi:hypothetical protein
MIAKPVIPVALVALSRGPPSPKTGGMWPIIRAAKGG